MRQFCYQIIIATNSLMEIYLIRHTTPKIEKGICYGQTDLDVTETFFDEVNLIKNHLPENLETIYSSPLQRCSKLAKILFPQQNIIHHPHLKEIDCGIWEMQHWDAIPKEDLNPFMADFVNIPMPQGESYINLFARVTNCFNHINSLPKPAAIVTHGGVYPKHSIASHQHAFNRFFQCF